MNIKNFVVRLRPMRAHLVAILSLFTGYAPALVSGQTALTHDSIPSATKPIYVKIVLPMKEPVKGNHPLVESWIAKDLQSRGKTELRAVTNWVRLAENGEQVTRVWDGSVDGKNWGCPVAGRVLKRAQDGKVRVSLVGWAPFAVKVTGTTLPAETGSRNIAVVDDVSAYVAIFVGPPSSEARPRRKR